MEKIQDKEQELEYCETETRKQAEKVSVLSSSILFRDHSKNKLQEVFQNFSDTSFNTLQSEFNEFQMKILQSIEI